VSRYVDEHRGLFGVEPICKTLGVSVSAYYQRRNGRRSDRAVEDERLLGRIRELHAANYYAYGYRRMWKALRRAGEQVPRCQVQRLMRVNGIVGAKRRGKPWRTTRPDPRAQRRPDLVQRDFAVAAPNELWVADLTYLRCWDGLVFFAFVLDAYSRMIVGWQLAGHMRTDLVLDALRMALHRGEPGGDVELIHHSDRGSQYTSHAFDEVFRSWGLKVIRTSVQAANANAHAERWVRTVRTDCLDRILILGRRHLEHVLRIYRHHYNEHGPTAPWSYCLPTVATQHHPSRRLASTGASSSADSSTNTRPPEFANPTGAKTRSRRRRRRAICSGIAFTHPTRSLQHP
jgi:putative transposase